MKTARPNNPCTAAFTLVEALIATGILAIGAAGLYSAIGYGLNSIAVAREERRATQLLLEATETLRLYTWEQLHSANFLPTTITNAYNPYSTSPPGVIYTTTITVTDAPTGTENYLTNLSQVTIAVDWNSRGKGHDRIITTFITHNGLQAYVY